MEEVAEGEEGEGRRNRRLSCIFECNERSLTRSAPLSPREISTRRDPATTGACTSRIYVTKMSKMRIGRGDELGLTLCLNLLSLSLSTVFNYDYFHFFSTRVSSSTSCPTPLRSCVRKYSTVLFFKLCVNL